MQNKKNLNNTLIATKHTHWTVSNSYVQHIYTCILSHTSKPSQHRLQTDRRSVIPRIHVNHWLSVWRWSRWCDWGITNSFFVQDIKRLRKCIHQWKHGNATINPILVRPCRKGRRFTHTVGDPCTVNTVDTFATARIRGRTQKLWNQGVHLKTL